MENKQGYRAVAKYLLISPSKVRPVANLVRGKSYKEAEGILRAMPQKGARLLLKVLNSAGANAMDVNSKLGEEDLYVSTVFIDDGPRMKRVWPRSHGRRDILLKRMSHITVVVDEKARLGE
ncbi:MAG: 50S ribosomal protein L22 [Spirochaetia bacterium]|jgi:large subunit ribosomal protein L22|nr:50S ribosomal protein L22 [Spirochaetia bacterium]